MTAADALRGNEQKTGVSLTNTMACTFYDAYKKALELGLDMNIWVICKA